MSHSAIQAEFQSNWLTPLPDTGGQHFGLCVALGCVWLATGSDVDGYDRFTGARVHHIAGPAHRTNVRGAAPLRNSLVVAYDDNGLYWVRPEKVESPALIAPLVDKLIWLMAQDGVVWAQSPYEGLRRIVPGASSDAPPIVDASFPPQPGVGKMILGADVVLLPSAGKVVAVDMATMEQAWSVDTGVTEPHGVNWSATNGSVLCLAIGPKLVVCISILEKRVLWQAEMQTTIAASLACDERRCYAPLGDGSLVALDLRTGKPVTAPIKIDPPLTYGTFVEDGIFYGYSNSKSMIFAVPLASGTVLRQYVDGINADVFDVQHGVLFYSTRTSVAAIRLSTLAREFFAEATLLQDMSFRAEGPSGAVAANKVPMIETEITLTDDSGAPRALAALRIGATEAARITLGGVPFDVGPDRFAEVRTDAAGRLRFALQPGTRDSSGALQPGLACAGLTLFGGFMDPGASIVIRPDAQLQNKLAGITANELKHNAKDYDGELIVLDQYRNDDRALDNTAKMVAASATMVHYSIKNRNFLLGPVHERYLAEGCDMRTICCCPMDQYACQVTCEKNFAFDLDPTTTSFGFLDKVATEKWLRDHPVSEGVDSAFDLWDEILRGAAAVKNAIVYVADETTRVVNTVVTVLKDGVLTTVNFLMDTIDKAIHLVHGIFNTIVGAMSKVLEFLSTLFSWKEILELKSQMQGEMTNGWNALVESPGQGRLSLLARASADFQNKLTQLRFVADKALQGLARELGQTTPRSSQKRASPQRNPSDGGSTSNWLQARVDEHLMSEAAVRKYAGDSVGALAFSLPQFTLPDDIVGDIDRLIARAGGKVTEDALRAVDAFRAAIGGSGDIFSGALSALVEVLRGVVNAGLDAALALADGFFALLEKVLRRAWTYLNTEIKVPFLSDFYSWATSPGDGSPGSKLTLLDLSCLLIAIPTHVIMSVKPGIRQAGSWPISNILGTAAGVAQMIWGVVGPTIGVVNYGLRNTFGEDASPLRRLWLAVRCATLLAFGLVARMLLFTSGWRSSKEGSDDKILGFVSLWLGPTLILVTDVSAAFVSALRGTPWRRLDPLAAIVVGLIATLICTGIGAAFYRDYLFEDWTVITFQTLSFAAPWFRIFVVPGFPPYAAYPAFAAIGAIIATSGAVMVFSSVPSLLEVEAGA